MATRKQLHEINKARAGDSIAQVSLAKRYLFGEHGLARNEMTALFWLERAARHGNLDACIVIGNYITTEIAQHSSTPDSLLVYYERAFSAGIDAAGLKFAELLLLQPDRKSHLQKKARAILEDLAIKNIPKAQWLLATAFSIDELSHNRKFQTSTISDHSANALDSPSEIIRKKLVAWTTGAALGGITEARFVMAESAWSNNDYQAYLHWALPEAEQISQQYLLKKRRASTSATEIQQLTSVKSELLYRCATCLCNVNIKEADKALCYLELAGSQGNKLAQLSFGLWLAKMDSKIVVVPPHPKRAIFDRAIGWLTNAGNQGLAAAWYALSKIYLKAAFAGRSVAEAERFLERAAEMGHCEAQIELGIRAWRTRHRSKDGDLTAAFWLQKATLQGSKEAEALLEKIAPRHNKGAWAIDRLPLLSPNVVATDPFLSARIELAALFGLSQLEALWLDINTADRGHCLVVDVAKHSRNTKRRIISVLNESERKLLDRIQMLFRGIECNENGPEGSYGRRLYRLNKLV